MVRPVVVTSLGRGFVLSRLGPVSDRHRLLDVLFHEPEGTRVRGVDSLLTSPCQLENPRTIDISR